MNQPLPPELVALLQGAPAGPPPAAAGPLPQGPPPIPVPGDMAAAMPGAAPVAPPMPGVPPVPGAMGAPVPPGMPGMPPMGPPPVAGIPGLPSTDPATFFAFAQQQQAADIATVEAMSSQAMQIAAQQAGLMGDPMMGGLETGMPMAVPPAQLGPLGY